MTDTKSWRPHPLSHRNRWSYRGDRVDLRRPAQQPSSRPTARRARRDWQPASPRGVVASSLCDPHPGGSGGSSTFLSVLLISCPEPRTLTLL